MKGIQSLVFLVLGVAVIVNAFPSERDVESVEDDTDYVPIPSVPAIAVPTGSDYGFNPSFYSFFPDFDLVSRIRGLVTRLRSQIGDSFGNIDWNKGNTTSTTKVIDGHVVTVNETSYKDDDTDLVLHVKVIDVKPSEDAEEGTEVSHTADNSENDIPLSAASSEDTEKNEIPNKPEEDVAESLEHNNQPEETREHVVETREYLPHDYLYDIDRPVEEVENEIEEIKPIEFKPIRLDDDIRVNKIMDNKGEMAKLPEDVEYFVPDNRDLYVVNENNEYVYNPTNGPIYRPAVNENNEYVYNPTNGPIYQPAVNKNEYVYNPTNGPIYRPAVNGNNEYVYYPPNTPIYQPAVNENSEYVYSPTSRPIYRPEPYARFPHRPRSEKLTSLT